VAAILALALTVWVALFVRRQILGFRDAADRVETAGERVGGGADAAAAALGEVPLVGGALSAPFGAVADAGRDLSAAGVEAGVSIDNLALVLPLALAALLFGVLCLAWLPGRIGWVREAAAVAALPSDGAADLLLAQRALGRRELRDFRHAGVDPVEVLAARDWRRLADVEYHALGLRR
jgi:hypothetical protein